MHWLTGAVSASSALQDNYPSGGTETSLNAFASAMSPTAASMNTVGGD